MLHEVGEDVLDGAVGGAGGWGEVDVELGHPQAGKALDHVGLLSSGRTRAAYIRSDGTD